MRGSSFHENDSPFTSYILADPLPPNFKALKFEYDGTSDPTYHIMRFNNFSLLYQYTDGVKCRLFATTLTKSALLWFGQLPPGSIGSFEKLSSLFLNWFFCVGRRVKPAFFLSRLKQHPDESLRRYITRFNKAIVEEPSTANDQIKTVCFIHGLVRGDFLYHLEKKEPESYDELMIRAQIYVNMEETMGNKRKSLDPTWVA